jgi:hypothetical protein
LIYHDQDLTVTHPVKIWKQTALVKARKAYKPQHEFKETAMTVSKLTEKLGFTCAGIKVL